MIKLQKVYKRFTLGDEELTILKDINLEIKEQDYVSILGQSGSGKSTLMYLIGLLDKPTEGKVLIDNVDTATLSDDETSRMRSQTMGFVFQSFNLINKLNVFENILLPTIYHRSTLPYDPNEKARELMKRFEIDHRASSYPNKISGGEQQRVSIARALILNPKIILADEPTGNLDSKTGEIILSLIEQLNKEDKKTIIIVTHDTNIANRTKRKINIMDGTIQKQ